MSISHLESRQNSRKLVTEPLCSFNKLTGFDGYLYEHDRLEYSDPSLYRASPIAASLLRGIFYSAFFTVNPDWLRGFTVV